MAVMKTKEKVIQSIFTAVDELNQQLPREQRLEKSGDTVLMGDLGKLDSMGLIKLIVEVEQQIENTYGVAITLSEEKTMSQVDIVFKTIGTLADHLIQLMEENED
mgnify:CR=1 FL=1